MIFILNLKGVCMRVVALNELLAPSIKFKEAFISSKIQKKLTKQQIHKLFSVDSANCEEMAAVPQGAFAARKVREMKKRQLLMMDMNENGERGKDSRGGCGSNFKKNLTEGRELTPLKYNSKLMNSIWGLYNRYSPHNFKKNTDADEEVFTSSWEKVLCPHSIPTITTSAEII